MNYLKTKQPFRGVWTLKSPRFFTAVFGECKVDEISQLEGTHAIGEQQHAKMAPAVATYPDELYIWLRHLCDGLYDILYVDSAYSDRIPKVETNW